MYNVVFVWVKLTVKRFMSETYTITLSCTGEILYYTAKYDPICIYYGQPKPYKDIPSVTRAMTSLQFTHVPFISSEII